LLFCASLAAAGWLGARLVPGLSAAAAAILLGFILGNLLPGRARFRPGAKLASGRLLEISIALLGLTIPLAGLPGPAALFGLLCAMVITHAFAAGFGRVSGLGTRAGLLGGVGTAVCGSAAIAAASPLLRVQGATVAAALASINLLSAGAMFLLPAVGTALGLDDTTVGWWTGGSLQAMGQAVGAGFAFSDAAGETATAVKLFRVATLLVVLPALALAGGEKGRFRLPWFIPGFAVCALLAAVVPVPAWPAVLVKALLWTALAGIGAGIDPGSLRHQGPRMLLLCALAWLVQLAGVIAVNAVQTP
jgi:uncharacterized integral membrane protein (TIGR00698 family)